MSGGVDSSGFDKQSVRRGFERGAARYDSSNFLAREIGTRMEERLELLRAVPTEALDVGSGTGAGARMLRSRYPACRVVEIDFALQMLEQSSTPGSWWQRGLMKRLNRGGRVRVCADIEQLPFSERAFDMVWSNLVLHWTDLSRALPEVYRVLRPGGVFMFSTLGPDTLKELRASYAEADGFEHVNRFVDLHDIGDMLVQSRFGDPVMDMEQLTLTYASVDALLKELRSGGAGNANAGRPRGLSGKRGYASMRSAYERFRIDGRVPATFEVVYGHAWRPQNDRRSAQGESIVEFHPRSEGGRR